MSAPSPRPDRSTPPTLTRREVIAGGLVVGGALTAGVALTASGVARAADDELSSPGKALENAKRMILEPPPPPDPGDLGDGEILFPIVVGEDDWCYVLDNFGDCRGTGCSRSHEGVDIMADQGLPIRAVEAGVLEKRYEDSGKNYGAGHGWTLFSAGTNTTWRFFHMDSHEEGLEVGDEVEFGQIIGYVGNTGTSGIYSDTNYHLHFERRPGDVARDSFDLLQRDPNVTFAG